MPRFSGPPGEAPLRVVPGENRLVLDEAVILLPLVSPYFPALFPAPIGEAGTIPDPADEP